jgi:hypothetical protein
LMCLMCLMCLMSEPVGPRPHAFWPAFWPTPARVLLLRPWLEREVRAIVGDPEPSLLANFLTSLLAQGAVFFKYVDYDHPRYCCYYYYNIIFLILLFAFVFGTAYAASDCASSLAAFRVGAAPFLQGHVIMFSGTILFSLVFRPCDVFDNI